MEIKGKVHCFFEQSGTFKREFIKLGIPAEDYDIQNNFGETDHTDDLFKAIEDAYDGKPSLWDNITQDDLIMAFFPCIYFCEKSQVAMTWDYVNYRKLTPKEKSDKILERSANREKFFRNISASPEEKQMLKEMIDAGSSISVRIIAEDNATDISKLL